jgi:hypothetical protein
VLFGLGYSFSVMACLTLSGVSTVLLYDGERGVGDEDGERSASEKILSGDRLLTISSSEYGE